MDLERDVAEALGLRQVPGSGNQWHRTGDGRGRGMVVSCKSTADRTWAQTRAHLREAIDMAAGTGDAPLLAIEDPKDGERLVVVRLADLAELLGNATGAVVERRGAVQRRLARTPVLKRAAAGDDDPRGRR